MGKHSLGSIRQKHGDVEIDASYPWTSTSGPDPFRPASMEMPTLAAGAVLQSEAVKPFAERLGIGQCPLYRYVGLVGTRVAAPFLFLVTMKVLS